VTAGDDTAVTTEVADAKPVALSSLCACLVVIHDATKEHLRRRVDLRKKSMLIGRDKATDLVLERAKISRKHARIESGERGTVIIDEGSTNGTLVNDQRLEPATPYVLRTGDQINIGGIVLKYLNGHDIESQYQEEIYQLTEYDTLTGLRSRRHFDDALPREVTRCHRYGRPLSLLMLDIDRFKQVNDTWGHDGGDEVLRAVAQCVLATVESNGVCARFGGEEMAIVLPETTLAQAAVIAERVRRAVESATILLGEQAVPVTVSIGCAEWLDSEDDKSLTKRSDERLYQAKRAGRNRVCC